MNYDTSLCSQHVYSFRAPIIRNIWLFRRYVSYLALSNYNDVDSRDNSEYTRVCLYVRDVWYEMCVLIPSSVIWTCGSSSPADFIISTRLLCALLLCLLSVCNILLCCLLCCLLCEPWCTWCSLCCGNGISNWCHHCTVQQCGISSLRSS